MSNYILPERYDKNIEATIFTFSYMPNMFLARREVNIWKKTHVFWMIYLAPIIYCCQNVLFI